MNELEAAAADLMLEFWHEEPAVCAGWLLAVGAQALELVRHGRRADVHAAIVALHERKQAGEAPPPVPEHELVRARGLAELQRSMRKVCESMALRGWLPRGEAVTPQRFGLACAALAKALDPLGMAQGAKAFAEVAETARGRDLYARTVLAGELRRVTGPLPQQQH